MLNKLTRARAHACEEVQIMSTNPRKDPSALAQAKGNKGKLSKAELDERESHELYVAGGDISPPKGMDGPSLEMFKSEAAYMMRVNEAMEKDFYGSNDAAPLQVMVEAHFRYLHYAGLEKGTRSPEKLRLFNQLKNKEAQTEKSYRQALKLDPASRVDFGEAAQEGVDGKDYNV